MNPPAAPLSPADSPRVLPSPHFHASNHLWVNNERQRASVAPLARSSALDDLARDHAREMAENGEVYRCFHPSSPIRENEMKGPSIKTLHQLSMCSESEARNNILNPGFREFGMGAAKGKDNHLYVCQLFS